MIKAIRKILILSVVLSAAGVYAQVATSVTGGEGVLWAGGEFSDFRPDYGSTSLFGPAAIFDFNVTPKIGVVGEARWLDWHNAGDIGETQRDYLIGGKYRLYRWRKFDFDVKGMIGGVWIKFPDDIGKGSYFAYAPGAFVDYRLSNRFHLRGDYEYQLLPSAPNIPGQPNDGLTPHGFSIGLEYNILHTR
ncbi:MAG TPA: outer membrane beta-barrel protein [Silvibacterium sp.]|nr:outer membrane beta-barrel protein [Silvibacterium sp.]